MRLLAVQSILARITGSLDPALGRPRSSREVYEEALRHQVIADASMLGFKFDEALVAGSLAELAVASASEVTSEDRNGILG